MSSAALLLVLAASAVDGGESQINTSIDWSRFVGLHEQEIHEKFGEPSSRNRKGTKLTYTFSFPCRYAEGVEVTQWNLGGGYSSHSAADTMPPPPAGMTAPVYGLSGGSGIGGSRAVARFRVDEKGVVTKATIKMKGKKHCK